MLIEVRRSDGYCSTFSAVSRPSLDERLKLDDAVIGVGGGPGVDAVGIAAGGELHAALDEAR